MNENLYLFLFSLSIAFAAIIGIFKYRSADTSYRPFLWYIFISLLNELLVGLYLANRPKILQVADWNIFNLFECIILITQFYYWQLLKKYGKTFIFVGVALSFVWLGENIIYSNIYSFNYVFLILYSFVLNLFSINTINQLVLRVNRSLFRNSMFIICVAFVIYFIYTIIVFTFLLMSKDKALLREVFGIKVYVNALVNLMYAIAVYFIPDKVQKRNFFDQLPANSSTPG